MKRTCMLAVLAMAFTITARAGQARAQSDVAGKWYDEVRGIIEDLAKQKLAEGLSAYLAEKQHAACYYLKGALGRMQSGYWGGVPGALREDALELLSDWIYYMVMHADTGSLAENATEFIASANTRYPYTLSNDDTKAAQRPCSSQWWDKRGQIGVSLVSKECNDPTGDRERVGCGVAQATMAYLRRDTASMRRHVSELSAWAISAVVTKSDAGLFSTITTEFGNKLSGWIYDASSLTDLLLDVDALLARDKLAVVLQSMSDGGACPEAATILLQAGAPTPKDFACLLVAMKTNLALLNKDVLAVSIAGGPPQTFYHLKSDVSRIIKARALADQGMSAPVVGCGITVELFVLGRLMPTSLSAKADGTLCGSDQAAETAVSLVRKKINDAVDKFRDMERLTNLLWFVQVAPEKLPEVASYLSKLAALLRELHKDWSTSSQDWSLVLALDVLRDALRELAKRYPEVPLAKDLLGYVGLQEIATLTYWADRRNYRDIALTVFEVFEAQADKDKSEVAEVRLLAKFVSFVLDSTDTVSPDGLSTAAFRSAAMDYLSNIDKGFPIPSSTEDTKVDFSPIPSAALRYSWNPDYRSAATADGFRRLVTVDWPRLNIAVSRYAGFQFSVFDLVGPLTESALRADFEKTEHGWNILWDWVRPRFNAYLMVPQITRNLAVAASASWRPLEVLYPAETPTSRSYCGPGSDDWSAGTAEVNLAVLVAF